MSNYRYAAQTEQGKGAGVKLQQGLVRNCRITRCKTDGAYQSGAGLHVAGGLLTGCEIDHCSHVWSYLSSGTGIYQTDGTITNCWIHHNSTPCAYGGAGVGVSGGLMTHCLITDNGTTAATEAQVGPCDGSGAYVSGTGLLRNCIIRDNVNSTKCAGVAVKGGRVEHCTVCNNNAASTSSGNSGLVQSDGTVLNTIVYGNGAAYVSLGSVTLTGGLFATNLIDVANAAAIDCVVSAPGFVDAAANDFHLKLGSAAIDKGAVLLDEDFDFDGVRRDDKPDLGAYEYVSAGGPLSAGITVDHPDCPLGASPSAAATVEGADTDIVEYGWFVVDGGEETKIGSAASVVWPNAPAGLHDLKLYVRNRGGEECTVVQTGAFNVHPYATFAATNGASVYPYDTWAKASTNVADALGAVWSGETESNRVVTIAAGTYPLTDTIVLDRAFSVVGVGKDLVILDGAALGKRGAVLSSDDALLQGVTIRNVRHSIGNGVGVSLSRGTLRDVRVSGCRPTDYSISGIGLYMSGGLAEDCDISGNDGDVYMHNCPAVGAYVAGGTFRNGNICRNTYSGAFTAGDCIGLYVTGGLVENVTVVSNAATSSTGYYTTCAGACVIGGTLRNALIWGNSTTKPSDTDGIGLLVNGASARVENCTVVGNLGAGKGARVESGTIANTIVADNENGDMVVGVLATVTCSR